MFFRFINSFASQAIDNRERKQSSCRKREKEKGRGREKVEVSIITIDDRRSIDVRLRYDLRICRSR